MPIEAQQVLGETGMTIYWVASLVYAVMMLAGLWKVFEKAGHPGRASLVPIYNTYIFTKIAGRPILWFILLFVPGVNFIVYLLLTYEIAKAFDAVFGFFLGMWFLGAVFYPILGFGSATYQGTLAE